MTSFDVKSEPTSSIDRNGSNFNMTNGEVDVDNIEGVDEQHQLSIERDRRAAAAAFNSKYEKAFALINESREICLRDMKKLEDENEEKNCQIIELKQTLNEKEMIISHLQDQISKNERDNENRMKEATEIREHERKLAREEVEEERTHNKEENERLQVELRMSGNKINELERERQEFRLEARIRQAVEEERDEQKETQKRAKEEAKALQDQLREAFDAERQRFDQDLALKDARIQELQQAMKSQRQAETKSSKRSLQIGKEKGTETATKTVKLDGTNGTIQTLQRYVEEERCEMDERRGEDPAKSKIYAFDWSNPNNAARFAYETNKNKWQQIDFGGALPKRRRFGLTNIGRKLFITGGYTDGNVMKDCQLISLTHIGDVQTVESFPDLNTGRSSHCVLSTGKKIFVFGGWNSRGALSSIECYGLEVGIRSWAKIGKLCEKRRDASGAVVDGVAYVIGGFNGKNDLNSMERFDPREGNKCVAMKAMKESRRFAAAAEHNGRIYVSGGSNGKDRLDTVEIFDPHRNKWTDGPRMNNGRCDHALVSNGNRLIAIGGDGR